MTKKKKVVVAMSGGVDSSVAAGILKEKGYDVIGITLQLYTAKQEIKTKTCCSGIDIYDAKEVARKLDIPHYYFEIGSIETFNDNLKEAQTEFDEDEMKYIKEFQLLTNKETIYVCNTDEESITQQNSYIDLVGSYLKDKGLKKINISADIESQLSLLEISEQKEFLNTIGLEEPGLNKLIIEGYKALQLITFFTSGPKESKAWTIKKGSLAPQAAGKIHTDFEKGFIRAETISYNELNSIGNFIEAKENGKLRSEGKEYIVKDGDIMNFRFNV